MSEIHTFNPVLHRVLKNLVKPWFRINYPVKLTNPEILKEMKPPYLLLPNHMMKWDMVLLGLFIKDPVHYMAADSHFRKNPNRYFMKTLGAFPKAKAKSDLGAIRHMIGLKEKSRVISIFPEGQMSWDGGSLPLYYSTAKLIKLLKIPVYVPVHSGAYSVQPRWAKAKRKGPIELTIHPLYKENTDWKSLTPDQIYQDLAHTVSIDEYRIIEENSWDYDSRERAEYLENVLFLCPECRSIAALRSGGNHIICDSCGFTQKLNSRYRWESPEGKPGIFPTPREWNAWQRKTIKILLNQYMSGQSAKPFMMDRDLTIQTADKKGAPRVWTDEGELALMGDHLLLRSGRGEVRLLPLKELSGINVMMRQRLEMYHQETFYVFDFPSPRISGYKWLCALRTLGLPSTYAWPGEEIEKL